MRLYTMTASLLGLALLAAPGSPRTPPVHVPPGVTTDRPREREKDAGEGDWFGLVCTDRARVYAHPDDADPAPETRLPTPRFGQQLFVLARAGAARSRLLVADFDPITLKQRRLVGWIDPEDLLDRRAALSVDELRKQVIARLPLEDDRGKWLRKMLPLVEERAAMRLRTKALTDFEQGLWATPHRLSARDHEAARRAGRGRAICEYSFYYVHAITVTPTEAHVLLGYRDELHLLETGEAGGDLGLVGWVPLAHLAIWATRQGAVPNNAPAAHAGRAKDGRLLTGYGKEADAWAAAGGKLGTGLALEKGDAAPPPTPPGAMGYILLGSKARGEGKVFHMAVPLQLGANTPADPRVVDDRRRLLDAARQMRTIEIVLSVDLTGSMGPSVEALSRALIDMIRQLRDAEKSLPQLDQAVLRVALCGYRDLEDGPGLVEDAGRYFEVMNDDEMAAFMAAVKRLRFGGGGDRLEQPLYGLKHAVDAYIAGRHHAKGAASCVFLAGDAGPHPKGAKGTLYDVADAVQWLGPVSPTAARVKVYPIFVKHHPDDACAEWAAMAKGLATATGGLAGELQMAGNGPAVPGDLVAHLRKVVGEARGRALRERSAAADRLGRRTGDGTEVVTVDEAIGWVRLGEIIPPVPLAAMRERLSRTGFGILYAPERVPGDAHPRWLFRTLLTEEEVKRTSVALGDLALSLDRALTRSTRMEEDKAIRELVVRMLLVNLGEEITPEDLRDWVRLPLDEIDARISSLPVPLGVLAEFKGPLTRKRLSGLMNRLRERKRVLDDILRDNKRWVSSGLATGRLHVWLSDSELP